tara:strand:+ start:286 stop:411 length:126 start_codon:yes stop_codon:yes gene_type:complete
MKLFLILVFMYFFYKVINSLTIKRHNDKNDDVIDVDYEEVE